MGEQIRVEKQRRTRTTEELQDDFHEQSDSDQAKRIARLLAQATKTVEDINEEIGDE